MKKRIMGILVVCTIFITALSGCGSSSEEINTDNESSKESVVSSEEKQTIEFWYHDGNPTSNPIFEELIRRFEEKYPQYDIEYVGLPNDSYLQKYTIAVTTNTVPDIISMRDMDLSAFINQDALMPLDDILDSYEEKDNISPAVINAVRSCSTDGKLYAMPQYITSDISWANTALMEEKGIEPPKTIDEFMEYCEKYADPAQGKYFYSLRGGAGSMENMFDFIFTYAGEDSLFDEEGNCVLNGEKFVEGLEKYASIYWNGWTSKDSVTNSFKEMVAEFGSQTSMYISHNSSSLAEHKKNLGEGNFMNVIAPANEDGIVVTKDLSFVGYSIFNGAKNKEGAIEFMKYLVSGEGASYLCEQEGRVPINDLVYEEEWYKNDPYIQVYGEMMKNENVKFLTHAIWLPQWNEFRTKYQEPGLQAVLLKEKTAKEVLDTWAEYLTNAQKEYLQSISK